MKELTFGSFLTQKRLERDLTLRGFAGQMDLSPVYVCNIEKDRKPAPREDVLQRMAALLLLSKYDTELMYDLAAKSKNAPAVSGDLPKYIMERDIVRIALRTAKDADATDEEWQEFIERIRRREIQDAADKMEDGI